ncbi:MAG: hypothetical protein JST50_10640 [Bacteroidetes bacterium]|nr:hypothetical protein [Bacteroidota bacterium]
MSNNYGGIELQIRSLSIQQVCGCGGAELAHPVIAAPDHILSALRKEGRG